MSGRRYRLTLAQMLEVLRALGCRIFIDEEIKALIVRHPAAWSRNIVLPDVGPTAALSYEVPSDMVAHIIRDAEHAGCFTRFEFRTAVIRVRKRATAALELKLTELRARLSNVQQELRTGPESDRARSRRALAEICETIRTLRPRLFLSHTGADKPVVEEFARWLKFVGAEVFVDEWCLQPGESIIARLQEEIENADQLVVFLSTNSIRSAWVQREIAMGTVLELARDSLKDEAFLVCVKLDECEIPLILRDKFYIDLATCTSRQEACERLWHGISRKSPKSIAELIDEYYLADDFLPGIGEEVRGEYH